MVDVAVFFSEGTVADESCKTKVEKLGKGTGFGVVIVSETGAVETAENCGKLLEQDALEVGVFLVGANYIWGRRERVVVFRGLGEGRFEIVVDVVIG